MNMNSAFIELVKKGSLFRISLVLMAWLTLCGCASISDHTQAYLGTPRYAPVDPGMVQVLNAAPSRPFERLGEIMLSAEGDPSREQLEARLRARAAGLGASAVYIVSDQTHVYPVAYWDYWGPSAAADWQRLIVGIAIKYK
jgi:hypothetical protein